MATSVEIRDELVKVLRLDLVGPDPGDPHETETLPQPPSRWYLTGFLVPYEAREVERKDETEDAQLDIVAGGGAGDDEGAPDHASGRRAFFPSSIGVSVLVPGDARTLHVIARWGDYRLIQPSGGKGEG